MFKKMLLRRLAKELDAAVATRCMDRNEAEAIRRQAGALDWVSLIQLIVMITQIIMDYLDSLSAEEEAA